MRSFLTVCVWLAASGLAGAQNLLTNPTFEGNLNGWTGGSNTAYDAAHDATGTPGSGSAKTTAAPGTSSYMANQCIAVTGSTQYQAGGKILIPSGQLATGSVHLGIWWYTTSGCSGNYAAADQTPNTTSAASWVPVALDSTSPAGAQSALLFGVLSCDGPVGVPGLQANLDDMFFQGPDTAQYARWIPAVIHKDVPSKNARWRSDIAVLNTSGSAAHVTITMYTSGGPVSQTTQLGARSQLIQADVAGWLGVTNDSGALEVTSDQDFFLSGRTYDQVDATHTYGQDYDGQRSADLLGNGQTASLTQLTESSLFRTNIGITNTSGALANVNLTLYDGSGNQLWSDTRNYAPGEFYQYQQPYQALGGTANGYAIVTVNSGSGIVTYASVIDNNTGDPTTISMKR